MSLPTENIVDSMFQKVKMESIIFMNHLHQDFDENINMQRIPQNIHMKKTILIWSPKQFYTDGFTF